MSYEITYRKAVVKLQDGRTVWIIESGSNNCTECYTTWTVRGARDRGLFSKFVWYKKDIEIYVKTWAQRYIDDNETEDYKQWNDSNRQTMSSQYRASWRVPGNGDLKATISYLTNPNLDYDLALQYLTFRFEHSIKLGQENNTFKIDELAEKIDALWDVKIWLRINWVEQALREQKYRRDSIQKSKPKIEKEPGKFIIKVNNWLYNNIVIRKLTNRSLIYTHYYETAKRFNTESQAKKRLADKDLKSRFSSIVSLDVISIDQRK